MTDRRSDGPEPKSLSNAGQPSFSRRLEAAGVAPPAVSVAEDGEIIFRWAATGASVCLLPDRHLAVFVPVADGAVKIDQPYSDELDLSHLFAALPAAPTPPDTPPTAPADPVETILAGSCDDQFAAASRIAANIGYNLAAEQEADPAGEPVQVAYTNWRGEATTPTIFPMRIFWGSNEWHPEPGWLIEALDIGKQALRTFAPGKISAWGTRTPIASASSRAPEAGLREAADIVAQMAGGHQTGTAVQELLRAAQRLRDRAALDTTATDGATVSSFVQHRAPDGSWQCQSTETGRVVETKRDGPFVGIPIYRATPPTTPEAPHHG